MDHKLNRRVEGIDRLRQALLALGGVALLCGCELSTIEMFRAQKPSLIAEVDDDYTRNSACLVETLDDRFHRPSQTLSLPDRLARVVLHSKTNSEDLGEVIVEGIAARRSKVTYRFSPVIFRPEVAVARVKAAIERCSPVARFSLG